MPKRKVAPYGSWQSPISSDDVATGAGVPAELSLDGDDIYWLELHPEEGGRYALYRRSGGETSEVLLPAFNVRTRVHEYGGGSYHVHKGTVYFSNFKDQVIYRQERWARLPEAVTKEGMRYDDYTADEKRGRLIGVCEDHTAAGTLPTDCIASVKLDGSSSSVLLSGNDFYSTPRLDPRGSRLAWLTWNFPEMPWDGTELWAGEIKEDGSLAEAELIAGGREESILQPEWSPDGALYFISDKSGWWNIHRWEDGKAGAVHPMSADFGRPSWVFGRPTYVFESEKRIVCSFAKGGTWHLALIDTLTRRLKPIKVQFTELGYIRARPGRAFFLAGSPTEPTSVVRLNLADGSLKVLSRPKTPRVHPGFLSVPRHVQFTTTGRRKAYGFLYGPKNINFRAPRGEKPPLIVISHGGPTSAALTSLSLSIQAWTSRGFAVLDVNYGGSTGYGRLYRKRLEGQWGVVDVDDCVNGARHLVRTSKVDGKRLIIRGGSAGGYTTLCALTFRKVFRAGASYFGVSDAEALEKETHKFESRYSDRLIGPYPERRDLYRERSPINFVGQISCPVIFFQGLEDVIVPPSQSETMVKSLRERGLPVAYLAFEGEQHGFRKFETIKRAFDAELYFYSRVFGFSLDDGVEPVAIENLQRTTGEETSTYLQR